MYLHIHDNRTLKELQDDFSSIFPYLRLEFFTRQLRYSQHSSRKIQLNPYLQVVTIRRQHRNGAVELNEHMRVEEVEQILQKEYHLPVQIFHFTKAGWLKTDTTDTATLKELNDQGHAAFHEVHNVYAQVKNLV